MMTVKDLNDIEVQLDSTVPYYVPALVRDLKVAIEQQQSCDAAIAHERNNTKFAIARAEAAEREVERLTTRCDQLTAGYEAILSGERARLAAEREKVTQLRARWERRREAVIFKLVNADTPNSLNERYLAGLRDGLGDCLEGLGGCLPQLRVRPTTGREIDIHGRSGKTTRGH